MNDSDLLVLQSPFSLATISIGWRASSLGVPYVVIPRGNVVPALGQFRVSRKPILKWLLFLLFIRRLLSNAAGLVVMSNLERARWEALANIDRISVIPNPVVGGSNEKCARQGDLNPDDGPWRENRPFALFVGRIAHEKGLDLLLKCWPAVLNCCPRAVLIIAGPVGHRRVYRRLIRMRKRRGLVQSVVFSGWVEGDMKRRLLERARCVVLPSHTESYGNVVVEALAARTPVLASTGTPWQDIEDGAGRWLPRDPKVWGDAIADYLISETKMTVDERTKNRILASSHTNRVEKLWREAICPILAGR
ncbi:glycosyltransferase [Nitrospinota bacterium]